MTSKIYDVIVIGGGINGCGCAADAALRGLSVLLCEKDDIASKTSSASSQLIHGGLRYLEYYDFKLVKKALDEQQILLNIAPHLVHPLPCVLPHVPKSRPMWLLRLGLFLYDHLSRINQLPNSQRITRRKNPFYFRPLKNDIENGFVYYDATADDARLTIANALQAKKHGAKILTRTECIRAQAVNHQWEVTLKPQDGPAYQVKSKAIIHASGPWLNKLSEQLHLPLKHHLTLVKGSHIVVPALYEGQHAYVLQHDDRRIIFVIPYHGFSMIGTTDQLWHGDLDTIYIDPNEIKYLCSVVQMYFKKSILATDLIHTWSGVRPLLSHDQTNISALSRDYILEYTEEPAPLVTIYGGKITTYRQLSQQAIQKLQHVFPDLPGSTTQITPLPGAPSSTTNEQNFLEEKYPWLSCEILDHYMQHYGTLTEDLLKNATCMADLGQKFSAILYQREVDYLCQNEWVKTVEDLLWRRTKLGFLMTDHAALNAYLWKVLSGIKNSDI